MARIAVDARPLSEATTGIGRYTRALFDRMCESEHHWYLYSHKPLIGNLPNTGNITVRCGNVSWGSLSSPFAQVVFPLWARLDRIDVFWSPRHHLPLFLPLRTFKVVTIHDLVWQKFPQTMSRLGLQLERWLMPPSLRLADNVIAVSESTGGEVLDSFSCSRGKVVVIPEAPFLDSCSSIATRGDYFLFVGTLEPRKNLRRLLEAYCQYTMLVEEALPLKLCGGKGWGGVKVEEVIEELGLGGRVEVLGYVDDSQLPALYNNARALLIPSLYEGFGLPIVEAFSQGTPVLTSNSGAMQEVAGEAALLVDPLDVEGMAKALVRLTSDCSLVESLQKNALTRLDKFCWAKSSAKTLAVLEGSYQKG
ncbi:glycosyltransferase family 4 protein [Microbulbifer sp. SSSA002]|uniref:glycosyltransferase family 4 protein n=1 Tax=Microbulbifer sp. SSSA002 TaxID=3243376 RepID=UPI0040394BA4